VIFYHAILILFDRHLHAFVIITVN